MQLSLQLVALIQTVAYSVYINIVFYITLTLPTYVPLAHIQLAIAIHQKACKLDMADVVYNYHDP